MLTNHIKLTVEQVLGSESVILLGSKPWREFDDKTKKYTDRVLGTIYTVACPKIKYEHIDVKVSDKDPLCSNERLNDIGHEIWVTFEGFVGTLYIDRKSHINISCKAEAIHTEEAL
jgi:hypothetical protein